MNISDELPLEEIKHKSIRGVATLTGRTFILQIITLISTFFLTVFLNPSEYGTFFLVSAIINFFAYFSDVGLAAALIQKKDRLTNEELKTTFTIQQLLIVTLILVIVAGSSFLSSWYKLDTKATFLLYSLAFSLLLSSLKTIPSVLMERKLEFNKLVIPQIAESITFNLIAVYLAWQGFGIESFTWAVLIRGIVGLVLIYLLSPWRPGFLIATSSIKPLFKFGLPYQLNTFLAVIKDDGLIAFLGVILGPASLGLLGWAQKWAFAPLRFFMDPVIKVTFPAYSRLQGDRKALSKAVSKSIYFIALLVFPSLIMLIFLSPILVEIIPKYEKWRGALIPLYLISITSAWGAITTPLTNMFNAIGKVGLTFKLMVMWVILTWVFVPILSLYFNLFGAALGFAIVGSSSIIAIKLALKYVDLDFISLIKVIIATVLMAASLWIARMFISVSVVGVIILIVGGSLVYLASIFLLFGLKLLEDVKLVLRKVINK